MELVHSMDILFTSRLIEMKFYIQSSNPAETGSHDVSATTLDEYIESAFKLNTEKAIMFWSGVLIPLNYKYTISSIFNDALSMLERLIFDDVGDIKIHWPCSEFRATWVLSWNDDELIIKSVWDCVVGNSEKELNSKSKLVTNKKDFVNEWKMLLEVVLQALLNSGYSKDTHSDIKKVSQIINSIDDYGFLYRRSSKILS